MGKIPSMTHVEACKLVEDALERVSKRLKYVYLNLLVQQDNGLKELVALGPASELKVKQLVDEANILCNINWYGAYMAGAQAMYRALEAHGMLEIPKPKDWPKDKNDKIVNEASLKLYMSNTRNLDWFLYGQPNNVEISISFEKNKKGKVTGATAKFVKKVIKCEEI